MKVKHFSFHFTICIFLVSAMTAFAEITLKVFAKSETREFPEGYEIISTPSETASLIKTMASGSATIAGYADVNGKRYFVSSWSYERYKTGQSYNWIRPKMAADQEPQKYAALTELIRQQQIENEKSQVFSAQVMVDYVIVGNVGNVADPATGGIYGTVAYEYKIARNETTIADYAQFLNAVAKSDPYKLYNTSMVDKNIAGITRSGSDGSYEYSVIAGSGNRPITYVSWFDAARYANWLHNGQKGGDTETGAYTLKGATSGDVPAKNAVAKVWIPSENEWYKAAYYDPKKNSGGGGYWLYANMSNSMPGNDLAMAGAANFREGEKDYATTPMNTPYSSSQNYLTDVGAYGKDSQSFYGTNDQAGNVEEWNDLDAKQSSRRGRRGGSWGGFKQFLTAEGRRGTFTPEFEFDGVGFRVASAP